MKYKKKTGKINLILLSFHLNSINTHTHTQIYIFNYVCMCGVRDENI